LAQVVSESFGISCTCALQVAALQVASVAASTMSASASLPAGNLSDKGLDRVNACLSSILALAPEDYDQPKAKNQQTNLNDIAELLDHQNNPGAYRICQDALVDGNAVPALLGLSLKGASDAICNKGIEVLARLAFGNTRGAEAIAGDVAFLPLVDATLQKTGPLRLAVLQLAQAVAASSAPAVAGAVSEMVNMVAPQLRDTTFEVLPLAALEVMISASFHCPQGVALAVPPFLLEGVLAEDGARPAWLPADPQHMLVCGLFVTNLISASDTLSDAGADVKQRMSERLQSGCFMEYFVCALEAAAHQTEWPQGSGVFHSPYRLARTVQNLACLGYHRKLLSAVPLLVRVVEVAPDKATTDAALVALRALSRNVDCLKALLQLSDFRQNMLHAMCESGEDAEAKELASYLITVEGMFDTAQASFDESRRFIPHAPSVHSLAELFSTCAVLDGELAFEQLLEVLRLVPIGNAAAVQASLSGGAPKGFSFEAFARYVYGTPTLLGWWPSLMENTAEVWETALATPGPSGSVRPTLIELVAFFEKGAEGKSSLSSVTLLEEVLPWLAIPTEGGAVQEAFARIHGKEKLGLEEFARWLAELYIGLVADEREAAQE